MSHKRTANILKLQMFSYPPPKTYLCLATLHTLSRVRGMKSLQFGQI